MFLQTAGITCLKEHSLSFFKFPASVTRIRNFSLNWKPGFSPHHWLSATLTNVAHLMLRSWSLATLNVGNGKDASAGAVGTSMHLGKNISPRSTKTLAPPSPPLWGRQGRKGARSPQIPPAYSYPLYLGGAVYTGSFHASYGGQGTHWQWGVMSALWQWQYVSAK